MQRLVSKDLLEWKLSKSRKPLILKGARQVGKTYSLREFGKKNFAFVHSFNFESTPDLGRVFERDLVPKRILEELSLISGKKIDPNEDLIIFDEIQSCPKALTSLKYFSEEMPEQAVCSAGSLLGLQLNPGSFPVGKVDFIDLHPCSFYEFLGALGENKLQEILGQWPLNIEITQFIHEKFWHFLKLYFICGGLPEIVEKFSKTLSESLITAFKEARLIQNTLINSYLADVAKHSGKLNSMHIDRTWRSVPLQLSLSHDQTSEKFKFRDVVPGVQGYSRLSGPIDWLLKAGLIIRIPINFKAQEPLLAYTKENLFKLLMFDIGILGALANLEPQTLYAYNYGTYKGYFAENYVAQELAASGHNRIYAWREGSAEIEFILQQNNSIIPIEVKSGNRTKSQSLRVYSQKYKPEKKIILSGKMPFMDTATKTEYWPLYMASNATKN